MPLYLMLFGGVGRYFDRVLYNEILDERLRLQLIDQRHQLQLLQRVLEQRVDRVCQCFDLERPRCIALEPGSELLCVHIELAEAGPLRRKSGAVAGHLEMLLPAPSNVRCEW